MKNRTGIRLIILLFAFFSVQISATELYFSGSVFYRLPSAVNFLPVPEKEKTFPDETVFAVPPRTKRPLATGSRVLIASHSVVMYPGAVIRVGDGELFPLSGRISFGSEDDVGDDLIIRGEKFMTLYRFGELHVEITPEQDAWLVMTNNGKAWLKDHQRKVVDFQPGTEIYIPRFGNSKVKQRASSRWISPPEIAVVPDVVAVFYPEQQAKQASGSQEIASDSEALLADPVLNAGNTEELDAISESSSDEVAVGANPPASSAAELD
jgi:hypothetical protein